MTRARTRTDFPYYLPRILPTHRSCRRTPNAFVLPPTPLARVLLSFCPTENITPAGKKLTHSGSRQTSEGPFHRSLPTRSHASFLRAGLIIMPLTPSNKEWTTMSVKEPADATNATIQSDNILRTIDLSVFWILAVIAIGFGALTIRLNFLNAQATKSKRGQMLTVKAMITDIYNRENKNLKHSPGDFDRVVYSYTVEEFTYEINAPYYMIRAEFRDAEGPTAPQKVGDQLTLRCFRDQPFFHYFDASTFEISEVTWGGLMFYFTIYFGPFLMGGGAFYVLYGVYGVLRKWAMQRWSARHRFYLLLISGPPIVFGICILFFSWIGRHNTDYIAMWTRLHATTGRVLAVSDRAPTDYI